MLPYFVLLFVTAVLPLMIYQKKGVISAIDYNYLVQKRNKMTSLLFFTGFFILLALRDITVGNDLLNYKSIYEICSTTSFEHLTNLNWELGYIVYNKILSVISKNYRFFLTVTAFITIVPIYKLYSKEKKYSLLLIILFVNMPCFLIIFSGLRQALAISIGIIAYMSIENRKYVLSVLLILLATYFHLSALILILIYPAFYLKIKTKHLLYIAPTMLIIYVFKIPVLKFIINFMPERYITHYGEVQQTGALGMMILFLIFCVFSFMILDEKLMSTKDYFMRNILLIATILQFFVPVHGLVQRASYYFLIFVPVAILSIVQSPKKYLKNISDLAVNVMGCFFTIYFFCNAYFSTDNLLGVFPYKFFWSGQVW